MFRRIAFQLLSRSNYLFNRNISLARPSFRSLTSTTNDAPSLLHSSSLQNQNESDRKALTALYEAMSESAKTTHFLMAMTCKPCGTRSHHALSKHAYHKGIVLVQCPHCQVRHLIADHLGWFKGTELGIASNEMILSGTLEEMAKRQNMRVVRTSWVAWQNESEMKVSINDQVQSIVPEDSS